MITLQDVAKVYNEGRPNEVRALEGVNLALARGGVTVLKGPSGSGKTTLLSVIACMARPSAGRVAVAGEVVSSLPERYLTELRRTMFGFVFQRFNLIRGLSVLDNVLLPSVPLGGERGAVAARRQSGRRPYWAQARTRRRRSWSLAGARAAAVSATTAPGTM